MKNSKKKFNNHFIQKAFAKNFSNNGLLKYTYYKPNSKVVNKKTFNVNEINTSKHPIVIKKFYSEEIENGMNEIENEGIKVIKKIICKAKDNIDNKIVLKRKELYSLKFYFLLNPIRTLNYRSGISDLSVVSLFNEAVKKDKRSKKVIQESLIKIIIEEYKKYKKKEPLLSTQLLDEIIKNKDNLWSVFINLTFEENILINIDYILNSRLLIFKFSKNKLFLPEQNRFDEKNSSDEIIYSFMAISPNIGIMFYFDPPIMRGLLKLEKSLFFENDISEKKDNVIYFDGHKIEKERIKFIKGNPFNTSQSEIDELNRIFFLIIISNFFHNNDKYIYDILEESEEVQDICNAMFLIHNKDRFLSYQNEEDIKDAEIQIEKLNIHL